VTLQVASFADQQNARHAHAMLQGADIARAQLFDADVAGRRIWRLRIGPVDAGTATELAARVVGLGFGQPQRVRD
jgi:rare lipoprotein A